jgi:pilus assembly protein Flp/PilA
MKNLVARLRRLGRRRDEGASAVEYGLLVAFIAVAIAVAVAALGGALNAQIDNACDKISSSNCNPPSGS